MKQTGKNRLIGVMLIATLTMTLFSLMAFATDREEGKGTDTLPGSGLMSDGESILEGIESDLLGTGTGAGTDTGRDTGRDTERNPATGTGTGTDSGTETGMAEDGGGVGLVIGIGVAVVALIIVFVILSRSSPAKK